MFWISWILFPFLAFSLFGFVLSRVLKRNDVADLTWGLGFIFFAALHAVAANTYTIQSSLVLGLLTVWGLRLTLYLSIRNLSKPEDRRYAEWRRNWGKSEPIQAFSKVFLFQTLLLLVISSPILISLHHSKPDWGLHTVLGLLIFLLGFSIEIIADAQLYAFKKNSENQGKVLTSGLWKLSRHPNYFGEVLIWWGFYGICFTSEYWHVQLVGPVLITFLLAKFSGVPMLEKTMKEKGEAFESYAEKTPALFPFHKSNFLGFLATFVWFVLLDMFWLSFLMRDFYATQLQGLARFKGTSFDAIAWAVVLVYLVMTLGIVSLTSAKRPSSATLKGFIFGTVLYGTYELTNLAILENWRMPMVVVDIIWGGFLCATAAFVYFQTRSWIKSLSLKNS